MNLTSKLFCLFQFTALIFANPAENFVKRQVNEDFALAQNLNQFANNLFPILASQKSGEQISRKCTGTALNLGYRGEKCVFPFKYKGKTYTSCTTVESNNGKPWCAIKVDRNGVVETNRWADCDANCFSRGQGGNGNIVISPFSIHTALTMALIGSPTASSTHQQLFQALYANERDGFDNQIAEKRLQTFQKVMNFYKNAANNVKIKIANKVYASNTFTINPLYNGYLINYFKSEIERVNFADRTKTADTINNFVKDATQGLIDDIVEPTSLTSDIRMMLINAVYFKSNWLTKFKERDTKPMKFNVKNGIEINYKYGMNMKSDLFYANMTSQGFPAEVLELPYENPSFRMLLILPNENTDIEQLNLNDLDLINIDRRLDSRNVQLRLPKFKIEFEAQMSPILNKLGVTDMFNDKANFADIANEDLRVSEVAHKAVIEVNEEGSEAAGATSALIGTRSHSSSMSHTMIFDRPFYFVIQDSRHKLNLFMGKIVDPRGL